MTQQTDPRRKYAPPRIESEPIRMVAALGGSAAGGIFSGPFRENPDEKPEEGQGG